MLSSASKIFRYFLICFVVGVAIASFFSLDYFWLYLLALISIVLGIIFWQNQFWRWLLIGGVIITLGIFRYQLSLPKTDETKIWFYDGRQVDFQGLIIKEPDKRIDHTKLIIAANRLAEKAIEGRVLISVNLYPEYQYGDLLEINCKLKSPEPFEDFSYDRYLAKDKIYSQCSYSKVKLISRGNGDWLLTKIYQFKNKLMEIINANLPEPQASLFAAIILGARRGLPQDLMAKFNLTATTHLIAISGLNITIITAVLMELFLALMIPRKKAFWLITACLIFYIVLIGAPASAVRAAIMGWLLILAMYLGRLNKSSNALILAGSLMILINPKILRDDVGFQLSFLAVLGLIYFVPFFEEKFRHLPEVFGLKSALATTLAAQITTAPLIIYNFGRLSLIGPVVNLLVVPVASILTVIGTLVLFLVIFLPQLAFSFFLLPWLFLTYLIKVVEIFAIIPLVSLNF